MRLSAEIKDSFIAGVILIAPLVVTLIVLRFLVNWSLAVIDPIVVGTGLTQYTANDALVAKVVAAILILATVTVLGSFARWSIGRRLLGGFGRAVNFVPLVSTVYSSTRQVANSLVDRNTRYESVVLVEYPREGLFVLGLVTGESPAAVESATGEPVYNVFLPNSPNPTGGRLLLVPESDIHEIDMSVRRGLRMILTTGMGGEDEPRGFPAGGAGTPIDAHRQVQ